MKIAVIGSRNLSVINLGRYLPEGIMELVSGGAKGIDTCAKQYALLNKIRLTEFLPEYHKYGKGAPLKRNLKIIDHADQVIAFWDGKSRGTKYVIDTCKRKKKRITVYTLFDVKGSKG